MSLVDQLAPTRGLKLVAVAAVLVAAFLAACVMVQSQVYLKASAGHAAHRLVDFDAFYIAGTMGREGRMAAAYDTRTIYAAEAAVSHGVEKPTLPWAYPPQFDLLLTALAFLPAGLAYLVFALGSLAFYLTVLQRISGRDFPLAFLAAGPGLMATIFAGQNGFLTGGLVGLFALLALRQRVSAGLPLGLMVIKPHLGLGIAAWAVMRGRWAMVAVAAATVLVSGALATLVYGPGIWAAFLSGLDAMAEMLRTGGFRYFRLASVFAALRALGLSTGAAMAGQGLAALIGLAVIWRAARLGLPLRAQLGLATLCGLMISPYAYDYDMALYGIGFALIWPVLAPRLALAEAAALVVAGWVATSLSVWLAVTSSSAAVLEKQVRAGQKPAVAGLLMLGLILWIALRAGVSMGQKNARLDGPVSGS